MEQSARWHEASLFPEHNQGSANLQLDVDLQERIRSLLLSRNEKRPPKTPSPTPDNAYLSRFPDRIPIGNSLAPPRTYSFNPAKTVARLETINSLNQAMGATRFDGPAGLFDEGKATQRRRYSTNPDLQSDRISMVEERRLSTVSGVNHNTQGDLLGRKLSASDGLNRPKSSSPKRLAKSQTPQICYTLRTVAPNSPKTNNKRVRPIVTPGPRSFRLEADPEISPVIDGNPSDTKHHHGPSSSAVDALQNIQGHGKRPVTIIPSIHHPKSSQDVVKSTALARQPQNLLGSLPDAQSTTSPATESTATKGEEPTIEASKASLSEANEDDGSATIQGPNSEFDGAQLAEILAELPPINDESSSILSSDSIPLHVDEVAESSKASLLPKLPFDKDGQIPKPSPMSRALSMLSNISAKSGLRTPRRLSTTKENHIAIDKVDEGTTMNRSILPSEGDESHFYPQIIGKRSSLSLRPSNLTTRPSQPKKNAAAVPSKQQMTTESNDDASIMRRQQQTSESFQKVIVDLESLLKEALDIAGRASRENSEIDPPPPHTLRNGYRRLSNTDSDDQSSILVALGNEDNKHSHVVVLEPDDEDLYHGHFIKARDTTPLPRSLAATRHQSTVPPLDAEDSKQRQSTQSLEVLQTDSPTPTYHLEPFASTDWALVQRPTLRPPETPKIPDSLRVPAKEQHSFLIRDHGLTSETPAYTASSHQRPPIQPRVSSKKLQKCPPQKRQLKGLVAIMSSEESVSTSGPYVADFKNSALQYHPVYRGVMAGESSSRAVDGSDFKGDTITPLRPSEPQVQGPGHSHPTKDEIKRGYSLRGRHHFEIREPHGFSLSRSHRRAPIARDWGASRKRFVATMTCLNTALLGLIIGIYAGEVPAIQYALADDHHVVILGNVVFFLGLSVTTALFWPLPLLHGRKPYTMAALTILLPLLFPQALAINGSRSPYVATYRIGLLMPRAIAGLVMGFANMNFQTTLLDLFGASLQSGNPHQEIVDEYDVRRHGGGMGVWLGIWTWCSIGSIGIGFWIGASIISGLQVSWGFWILIILTSTVLLFNVLTPEVRRSAYRRSMAEVRSGTDISRRIARGEIKMHLFSTGPLWWWEEVWAGHVLCIRMLKQPGFAVLAFYLGWIYGQVVLIIVVSGNRHSHQ